MNACRLKLPVVAVCLLLGASSARAQGAHEPGSIVEYLRSRDDLSKKSFRRWDKAIRKRFGGAALKTDAGANVEVVVAKEIISAAIFLEIAPDRGATAAWEGYRGALGYVPPPIAIHYQILALQGRKPRGRPIDLAFNFPDFYNEEIAPDLVAYWEEALEAGTIPDFAIAETEEALDKTRIAMRPLLLDKLRLLASLDRDRGVRRGADKAAIESDMRAIESELLHSFRKVARRPEVLDARKRAFDRFRIQLEDMGGRLSQEDRYLDPLAPAPPRRPVPVEPTPAEPAPTPPEKPDVLTPEAIRPGRLPSDPPDLEPARPPPPTPPPAQPRPGDPSPELDPMSERGLFELLQTYRLRLDGTIGPWIGTPYVWGGSAKGLGTDCSGFTQSVFKEGFSVGLPRVSRDQFRQGRSVPKNALQPGDLLFFDIKDAGRISHVGIYVGDGRFAHASVSAGVTYAPLAKKYYLRAFRGARRVLSYPRSGG